MSRSELKFSIDIFHSYIVRALTTQQKKLIPFFLNIKGCASLEEHSCDVETKR